MARDFRYQTGFGNHFATECMPGALTQGQNSPQHPPYGLYAEQLSGTSFTAPREENLRSWLYRIRPSVIHSRFELIDRNLWRSGPFDEVPATPNQLRWDPIPKGNEKTDFLGGTVTLAGNGSAETNVGCAVHAYRFNQPMDQRCFYNSDGEFLFVPQQGTLLFQTELGWLELSTREVAVVPRGIKFRLSPATGECRGYLLENYGPPLRLPYLGPIGANGLANPRDFQYPVAQYEDKDTAYELVNKFQGNLWACQLGHSPFDVVAWHGNYAPYKYDLSRYQSVNTVSFDHPDPSIFTVLTSPSNRAGTAHVDFVIFPPRWMVAEHTFRPPYYHRNRMSEFMGLVHGTYDAKSTGFVPGGASLHNCMSPHGPDAQTFLAALEADLKPQYTLDTLAFMFESNRTFTPTAFAMSTPALQKDYLSCWGALPKLFSPERK